MEERYNKAKLKSSKNQLLDSLMTMMIVILVNLIAVILLVIFSTTVTTIITVLAAIALTISAMIFIARFSDYISARD